MTVVLTSTTQQNVIDANAQIDKNCGFPNEQAQTWSDIYQCHGQQKWYIQKPFEEGWNGISQSQMMSNVSNVVEENFDHSWLPPISEGK